MKIILLSLVVVLSIQDIFADHHYESLKKLKDHLLDGYRKDFAPSPVDVQFSFDLRAARYNKKTHVVETTVWESYKWHDDRLVWKPEDYDNRSIIIMEHDPIWTPDFKLYNEVDEREDRDETNVRIHSDGTVEWYPTALYQTYGKKGAGKSGTVHFVIGSWSFHTSILKISKMGEGVSLRYFLNETSPLLAEIDHVDVDAKRYSDFDKDFATLDATVVFKKRPDYDDDDDHHHHPHTHDKAPEAAHAADDC
ncbi:hypothetical protein HELRODRAFT_191142 [Helobdella robusta]|uniref:Neurotransmitter-gated ion-channel ligand-binding domain-containing protein n=1 Tax=Helobdella robusta TaxID=6412 RepID=T1FSN0_HELRO|nr:hypothetical protein HELRODRAFT_191142 [Helobdella robusta]ESO07333.1 hypothetical protein HELRODRAFT_191142 [Helobdella robusta]